MKDDDLPRIPSFEELGISPDEIEELERELAESGGESPAGQEGAGGTERGAAPSSSSPAETKRPKDAGKRKEAKKSFFRRSGKKRKAPPPSPSSPASEAKRTVVRQGPSAPDPEPQGEASAAAKGQDRPPLGGARGPLTLVVLLVLAWLSSSARAVPTPVSSAAPDSAFSAERAMLHVDRIAQAAHPPGSPEHERVRAYLLQTLTGLGLEPSVQTTTAVIGQGDRARAATVRNVLARVPGTDPTGAVLVTAHYDGRELARAAGDDGAGVATILESVRALRTDGALRNDLIVLLTDAEELGLLGARAFVDQHPWMADVSVVVSIEMRGGGGPSIMFETGDQNGWIVRALRDVDAGSWANSLTYEIYERLPNDTDFTPFKQAGRQGLNFGAIGRAHVYHQTYDSPENLSPGTVQHHGVQALAVLRELGDRDLAAVNAPDIVYFTVPFVGLVTYGRTWSYGLSALIAVLFLVVLVATRRFGTRWWGVFGGLGAAALAGGLAYGLGVALLRWLPRLHPEVGALHGSAFHSEGWYVLALASGCFVLTLAVLGLVRRWISSFEMALGASIVPVVAAVAGGVLLPMGSMNLQWPVLAALLAGAVLLGVGPAGKPGFVRWILLLLLAVPVIALLVPLTELIWVAMSFRLAPGLGVFLAVTLLLLVPLLDVIREPNGWWAGAFGLLLGGAFLGIGLILARPSASRPAPSTLVYALDRDTQTAVWATDPEASDGAYDAARAWAAARVGTFADSTSLERFAGARGTYATASAPFVAAPPPSVTALPGAAGVRLALRSRVGAEMMRIRLGRDAGRIVAVNGRPVPNDDPVRTLEHWGTPDGDIQVDVGQVTGVDLEVELVEHLLRPAELVGPDAFRRPPGLAPDITRSSDRAMLLTSIAVDPVTGEISNTSSVPTDDGLQVVDSTAADDQAPGGGGAPADSGSAQDTVASDTTVTGEAVRDTSASGAAIPDTTASGAGTPDTTASGEAVRDTSASGAAIPDTAASGAVTPPTAAP